MGSTTSARVMEQAATQPTMILAGLIPTTGTTYMSTAMAPIIIMIMERTTHMLLECLPMTTAMTTHTHIMALLKQDTLTLVITPTPTPMVAAATHTPMTMSTTTAMVTDTHTDRELVPTSTPVRSTLTPG